jgi:glycosyltransferase involved in cell wall biosynthesis
VKNILLMGEGAGYAGAEMYAFTLGSKLMNYEELNFSCALFYRGLLREKLKRKGVKVIDLFARNNLKSIRFIRKYVRENNIRLIHFVDLKSTLVGGCAAFFMRDVKTVATVHGLPETYPSFFMRIKYSISLFLYYWMLKYRMDSVICVSSDLATRLQGRIASQKIQIIHNGLESNKEEQGEIKNKADEPRMFIVGTVGRLDRVKGHTFLLECAKHILKVKKDVLFYIIGSGPLEEDLRKQMIGYGMKERVRFLGFREDAHSLIAHMDIFVLSSLHEGIPYVLLEAMSLSRPVVCTEVGGIREVVQNQVDGLLVPPEDPEALSQAILSLLNDAEYAAQLGRNARKKIQTQFCSDSMAAQTYALYESMIGKY